MQSQNVKIICQGLSYHKCPLELREQFSKIEEITSSFFFELKSKYLVSEIFLLSTCNRFEIYFVVPQYAENYAVIVELAKFFSIDLQKDSFIYSYLDDKAFSHIFKVVSSLDSMCVGETQIINQFKQAAASAKNSGSLGTCLERLTQQALFVGKSIRRQTSISTKPVSLSHQAVDIAKEFYRDFKDKTFVFIGAGMMVELALRYLKTLNPKTVYIINRDPKRAEYLTASVGLGKTLSFGDLEKTLLEADVVISSTSSSRCLLSYSLLSKVQSLRKGRSLCMVDIALPRDIDPACVALEDIYLFDLDDLGYSSYKKNKLSPECKNTAEFIIKKNVVVFSKWLLQQQKNKPVADFDSYLSSLFAQEFAYSSLRKSLRSLSLEQSESIALMLKSIKKKIIADCAQRVVATPVIRTTDKKSFISETL
jgi:glutamyl-tRNA reductase